MNKAQMVAASFEIAVAWAIGRLHEVASGNVAPASAGLTGATAAMAMAAVRHDMRLTRRMIELGAEAAAKNHLAFRMAAAAGDIPALSWLEEQAPPSTYAQADALAWARGLGREKVVERLTAQA